VYFTFFLIYAALSVVFIADVLRQPATALSGMGKALWILALLFVPCLRVGGIRDLAHAASRGSDGEGV
jgi:hypothetical protein